jgi:hypothetical protein
MGNLNRLPEPIVVTAKVTSVLEKLDVAYFIGGSLASTLYGMVRTTQDSDIIAELRSEHLQALVNALREVLLAKLEWYRTGGEVSDRQWRDVLGVLKVQEGSLDLDYLRRMARELKVIDLLERALKEV